MPSPTLTVEVDIDPVELSVNKRFQSNRTVHPEVRMAQERIIWEAKKAARDQGFSLRPDSFLTMDLVFTFRTFRADLDNPLKRTVDAMAEALGFNDSRLQHICLHRGVGGTHITISLTEMDDGVVAIPMGFKLPPQEAIWMVSQQEIG